MNRRLASIVSGLVLVASLTALDGSESQGNAKPAEQRNGNVLRIHRDKGGAHGRPAWAAAAVTRARQHLLAVRQETGLEDPDSELVLDSVLEDDMGQTHLRMNQEYKGIPVFGSQIIVELDDDSGNKTFGGADASARRVNTGPAIAGEIATRSALDLLGYTGAFASPPTTQLVILPASDERPAATLTWLVELAIDDGTEATAHHRYFIDAQDGRLVLHYDALNHASGTSYYSGTVPIETTYALLNDGKYMYRLWDRTRAMYTTDMLGGTVATGGVFSNTTNVWGNTYPYRETAGVDAHFGVTKAWDYFRSKQGWTGINGSGEGVVNRVHYGAGAAGNDAYASGGVLTFGSGDGVTTRPWVSLDVVAHEYTHAVIARTANLTYYGYSGALNESFADIFGTAVEFYSGIRPDYLIGEDIGRTLRSLENPRLYGQPDHFTQYFWTSGDNDNAGVHTNSGIPNKAFYLLAQGGTHPISGVKVSGISRPAAEWIFFRALRKLPAGATFTQARVATLSAAADGYGLYSAAWYSVKAAWDAVGVY